MNNVEKKIEENFVNWRRKNKRNDGSKEATQKDVEDFMFSVFQIKTEGNRTEAVNILDILDTMISPNGEASLAVNSPRENAFACEMKREAIENPNNRKKRDSCALECPSPSFELVGTNCFYGSEKDLLLDFESATEKCEEFGAELATINNAGEHSFATGIWSKRSRWIGLNDLEEEGKLVWPDSSTPSFLNWKSNQPANSETSDCVYMGKDQTWRMAEGCSWQIPFICSMAATCSTTSTSTTTSTTTTTKTTTTTTTTITTITTTTKTATTSSTSNPLTEVIGKRICIPVTNTNSTAANSQIGSKARLPNVDIFLNPDKQEYKEQIIRKKKETAENYFKSSDMRLLFPELFRVLWFSTLPCDQGENQMLLSCEVAGSLVNCSDLFTKVPTDSGMCCALNTEDSLRSSEYQELINEMQGETRTEKVKSQVGRENGLRLVLDLHSNLISLGTMDQQHDAFKLFIGQPEEFPMMRERSLHLQPGKEHFVELAATVVSSKDIKGITSEARDCFFKDEGGLEFYKEYTFSNCRLECAIKEMEEKHGCVPWHLPKVRHDWISWKLILFSREIIQTLAIRGGQGTS